MRTVLLRFPTAALLLVPGFALAANHTVINGNDSGSWFTPGHRRRVGRRPAIEAKPKRQVASMKAICPSNDS